MQLKKIVLVLLCLPFSLVAELSETELYANVAYCGYETARLEKEVLINTQKFISQLYLFRNITDDVYDPQWINELYTSLGTLKNALEERAKIVHMWQICTTYIDQFITSPAIEELRIDGQLILQNKSVALWHSISQLINQQYQCIEQTQTELNVTQNKTKDLLNEASNIDCTEPLQPLAYMDYSRKLGADIIHHGITLMQCGAHLTVQLHHIFSNAMQYFQEKYNIVSKKNNQNFYLLFDENGLITEHNRTIILSPVLGEIEKN